MKVNTGYLYLASIHPFSVQFILNVVVGKPGAYLGELEAKGRGTPWTRCQLLIVGDNHTFTH